MDFEIAERVRSFNEYPPRNISKHSQPRLIPADLADNSSLINNQVPFETRFNPRSSPSRETFNKLSFFNQTDVFRHPEISTGPKHTYQNNVNYPKNMLKAVANRRALHSSSPSLIIIGSPGLKRKYDTVISDRQNQKFSTTPHLMGLQEKVYFRVATSESKDNWLPDYYPPTQLEDGYDRFPARTWLPRVHLQQWVKHSL